jgi:hypothetical protein
MKIIATPKSLTVVDMPLQAKPTQFPMMEAVMNLATEVPVRIVGNTIEVDVKRPYTRLNDSVDDVLMG